MSEYSTDKGRISVLSANREPIIPVLNTQGMIEVIEDIFGMANRSLEMNPGYVEHHKKWQDAIIAKLRAADKLCEGAKEARAVLQIAASYEPNVWPTAGLKIHCRDAKEKVMKLCAAIANYEGGQ